MTMKVDQRSVEASQYMTDWDLYDALLGGTKAMRAATTAYMPKRPMETSEDYDARIAMATLFPAYSETMGNMTGRTFFDPITFGEDMPDWIRDEVLPDVDRQGRNFQNFTRDWFHEGLGYGLSFCLVDSPTAPGVRTREDQRRARIRPYTVQISPRRVLGWQTNEDGEVIQVRISFERTENGPWETRKIPQVRVYEIGKVSIFEKVKSDFAQIDERAMPLGRIPLVPLYTKRTGLYQAEAPLRELAFLNAKHWRMQSGNDALVDTASVPILAISGVQDGDEIVIGAKNAVRMPTGATMKYVEHTGKAIEAGRQSLDSLKLEMRQAGAKMLEPSQPVRIAAQAKEEAQSENSRLAGIVQTFQDTLNDVLDLIAEWRGVESGGKCELHPNLEVEFDPTESMKLIRQMGIDGQVSDQTVFNEAQRRGMLSEDLDWDEEQERIAAQGPV